jgi:hypothetical protein
MKRTLAILLTLLLAVAASPALAQTLTGTVAGAITDEQGGGLPGVSVSLVGKTRTLTAQTDEKGEYRFVGVDPGEYAVRAEIAGFRPKQQNEIVVNVGKQATVNLSLAVGGITETVDVTAEAPVVDVTSSKTDSNLSQSMLFEMPIRPDNAAVGLMDYLPGVNAGSAYGADEDTANGLLLDGVDVRDPEGGSAWTFFNFNIVEEVQVSGLGAPAEYGAFTGAVVNTITKSGGNNWEGLFDVYYTKDSLSSDNVSDELIAENATLGNSGVTNKRLDYTGLISGPIVRDKAFFFASVQRFELDQDPAGPRTVSNEVSPRFNLKLNWLPTPNDTLQFTFQEDMYNIIGRPGVSSAASVITDDITNREDAPEWVWGAQWRHLFGSKTFMEVKYTGWTGYYDLNPEVEAAGHFDAGSGEYSVSQGWYYWADRGRHQVNASLSHYAEKWGKHDLKFGVEIERSKVRSRYGYFDGMFYYDYAAYYPVGQYTAYNYGYDIDARNKRESVYVQDSWKVTDRLTLNPGLRMDRIGGGAPGADTVYSVTNWAPRLGFAFDLTGDAKTVLKGHYGQYYDGAFSLVYTSAIPGIQDFVLYAYDPEGTDLVGPNGNTFTEYSRSVANLARIDEDIKHPRVDEITLGLDRALNNDLRLSVTGVYREDKNLQATVLPDARWIPTTVNNGLTGQPITVYNLVDTAAQDNALITNPDGFEYLDENGNVLGTARAERNYKALIFTLDKRFRDRWQGRVSYVLAEAKGTVDNSGFQSYGTSAEFETPTRALVNSDGSLANDPRHELKIFASWQVPKVEANISAYWRTVSGETYTPYQQFASRDINFTTSATGRRVRLEPRGTRREDLENALDLRLEKIFRVGGGDDRLSLYADIRNTFNSNHVIDYQERYPDVAVVGLDEPLPLDGPTAIYAPRLVIVGARWSF